MNEFIDIAVKNRIAFPREKLVIKYKCSVVDQLIKERRMILPI